MQERADELDLYSSSTTTVLTSKAHWRWMNTSTARQECATLSLYTTSRTIHTDSAPMLLFAGCQNSTALNSLHYSIRSRVEVNFVDVCGYDTRRAGLPGIAAGSSAGTVFTKTSSIQSMFPYLCTAVLGYSTLPWR